MAGGQSGDRTDQINEENQYARDPGYSADERVDGRQPPAPNQPGDEGIEHRESAEPVRVTSKYADKRARMLESARELREQQQAAPELADEISRSRRDAFPLNTQPEMRSQQQPAGEQG